MDNIILKVTYGELFEFFDSDAKSSFVIGSKRSCDLVVKATFAAPEQIRCVRRDGVWYAEDLTPEGGKSEVLSGGKRFRRPVVRLDDELVIRKVGDKRSADAVTITPVRKISRRRGGDKLDLTKKTITLVGRNPSCDLMVDNPMVSEKHFRIVYDGKQCFIEDLHSINGTYVNNRKIRRAALKDYDRISIPTAAYVFYDKKLLYSTSAAGIQVDCVGVRKEVVDRGGHGGRICIVNNVSFRIEPGDFVAIVGGSGAGKSTLLDCMNGLRPATDGEIYYDTNSYYENIRSYKDLMGYVPQRDIMHDDLPLAEGLYYTALLRMKTSMKKDAVMSRVREAIRDVRLTGSERVRISSLSGGQRKRASIAMELLADPKVIFLDEPTSGLSPDLDLEMMDLLRDLSRKGRTIVVITHAMENLDKCDKIAFLGKGGRLCYYGDYDGIFRYFNRRSYSRIFAALTDEKTSELFERKYRASEYYKRLHRVFVATYGDMTATLLPPLAKYTLDDEGEEQTAPESRKERRRRKKNGTDAPRPAETAAVTETAPAGENGADGAETREVPEERAEQAAEAATAPDSAAAAPAKRQRKKKTAAAESALEETAPRPAESAPEETALAPENGADGAEAREALEESAEQAAEAATTPESAAAATAKRQRRKKSAPAEGGAETAAQGRRRAFDVIPDQRADDAVLFDAAEGDERGGKPETGEEADA